jgi:hypothetical protein
MDAEKVKAVLMPLLKELLAENSKQQENYMSTRLNDLALQIGKLETRFVTIEGIMANTKKPIKTKPVKATEKAAEPVPAGEELAAVVAEKAKAKSETFPNAYNWFTKQYKENEDFRKRYTSAEHAAKLAADTEVQEKDVVKKNFIVSAKKMHALLKSEAVDTYKAVLKEYEAAKTAHSTANKAPQEEKEPTTPK